ncbi:hypothetical protein DY000_02016318 [Brassica cretica]|uniref:Uncharacterized protein n=1 Tax=Brassica cretica TaxID=69181 RepID=A0ABQ7D3Y9_BRACR|nr:hypothetical protein DY000_02016318 [Brassica cretica]
MKSIRAQQKQHRSTPTGYHRTTTTNQHRLTPPLLHRLILDAYQSRRSSMCVEIFLMKKPPHDQTSLGERIGGIGRRGRGKGPRETKEKSLWRRLSHKNDKASEGKRKRNKEDELCISIARHLITVARQSITSIDRHLTVLIDTHISDSCRDCLKEPNLTSNTKLDTTACLGAWDVQEKYGDLEPFDMQNCTDASDFEVNQHPVADMPVLLKSSQSASREEAVEEMKDCRSMKQHWCRSTVMPEYGLSIFYDH